MQISDIFYHNKKHGYDELHLMILDENPNFPQNSSKLCIFKILNST